MALTDEDFDKLGSLRGMRVFAATIQEIVNDPSRDNDSFEDKIKEALEAQLTARDNKVIQTRLREAKLLGSTAALERFDAYPGRGVTQDRIDRLATCEWIDYGKDLIIVGLPAPVKVFSPKPWPSRRAAKSSPPVTSGSTTWPTISTLRLSIPRPANNSSPTCKPRHLSSSMIFSPPMSQRTR